MNYYVFQVSDLSTYGKQKAAQEVFDFLVKDHSVWGFGPNTPNRKAIQEGDGVLFYLTGQKNQTFVGSAVLASRAYTDESGQSTDWYADPTTLRIDLKDVSVFAEPKHRKSFNSLEWFPAQGGSSKITERDFNIVLGTEPDISHKILVEDDAMEFALEKYLEEFIISNWEKIDFGEKLTLFNDKDGNTGQQYYTGDVGYIDILAKDEKGNFVVIELKKGRNNDEVIGQILRYIGWVRKNLALDSQLVRGVVIVGERDKKLDYALSEISGKITSKVYRMFFKLEAY